MMEIFREKKNELVNRKEIVFEYDNAGKSTPKHEDVLKMVSDATKKAPDTISIKKIEQRFGGGRCKITAFVYDTKDSKNKYEIINKKKKVKKDEQPAAEPKK